MNRREWLAGAAFLTAFPRAAAADSEPVFRETTEQAGIVVETVATGLEHPWALAFLPAGGYLVTERPGRMRRITAEGQLGEPLRNLPAVAARGQGGLLDLALDPGFRNNGIVYFSYIEAQEGGSGVAVARAAVDPQAGALEKVTVIFRQKEAASGTANFGVRLVPADDDMLFITMGDRFGTRDKAQVLDSHLGKVLRIHTDGSVPIDNPFVGQSAALPEIWSLGHRNAQGAALHPRTGELWINEHGARGGDEVNLVGKGLNYGWPIITYGVDYSGASIGIGTAREGLEQPLYYWVPSIAPSGMAFYVEGRIAAWRNSVFIGALAGKALIRLEIDGGRITREERMLAGLGERIRDVRTGPDGHLYLLTDNARGRILRVRPA